MGNVGLKMDNRMLEKAKIASQMLTQIGWCWSWRDVQELRVRIYDEISIFS